MAKIRTGLKKCPVCGQVVTDRGTHTHWLNLHSDLDYREYRDRFVPVGPLDAAKPADAGTPEAPPRTSEIQSDEWVLKPPEVEMTEVVVDELTKKLPMIYGISKTKALTIVDTVKGNPAIALNPANLFMHITQLEPGVNAYYLQIIINGVFERLRTEGWRVVPPPRPVFYPQSYPQPHPVLGPQWWPQPSPQPAFRYPGYQPDYGLIRCVIDGQVVEMDLASYIEFKEWEGVRERERERWKKEEEERKLRLKKLEAEIKELEQKV